MRRGLTAFLSVLLLASACTSADRETETVALADSLADIATETNRSVAQFFDLMDDVFEDRDQLYQRILDLRLPTTIAINLDKAQRIDPPPGSEAELERYASFLGELLLAAEALDRAIATKDPLALAIGAVSIEVASGALAVTLPSRTCTALTPGVGRDLCQTQDLDGYEADLSFELRRFVASFRPAFRVPDTFGDVIRGRVLATLQADAALVLENAAERLDQLEPGTAFDRLHQIVLDYFPAATAAWGQFEADVDGSDPLIYGFIVDSLEAERQATHDRLEDEYELVLSALPDSQVSAITDIWFGVAPESVDGE
jgi:hypothetical protein